MLAIIITEMQIKTIIRYHVTLVIMATIRQTFWLSAWRRQRCNFLWSCQTWVHPTRATSTMLFKFNLNEIKALYLRCTGGKSVPRLPWPPRLVPWVYLQKRSVMTSPRQLVIGRVWGLQWNWPFRTDRPRLRQYLLFLPWSSKPSNHQETERSRIALSTVETSLLMRSSTFIAQHMWHWSLARELSGTIKEILGIAQSVGCNVAGCHLMAS